MVMHTQVQNSHAKVQETRAEFCAKELACSSVPQGWLWLGVAMVMVRGGDGVGWWKG